MESNKTHLCDACGYHPAECIVPISDIEFGDGPGNDNVVSCAGYKDKNSLEES